MTIGSETCHEDDVAKMHMFARYVLEELEEGLGLLSMIT
jgi:hypothetical protein